MTHQVRQQPDPPYARHPRGWWSRVNEAWLALTTPHRALVSVVLLLLGTLPVLTRLSIGATSNDIRIFQRAADAVMHGVVYRDVVFEYPPYALPWFLPPYALSHDLASFRLAFGLEMWAIDAAIKAALLWYGVRARRGLRDLTPFVAYSLGSGALGHLLLQRYDLIPAAISLAAVFAIAGDRPLLAGALVALGAGIKIYPALLFPVFASLAWQRGRGHLGRLILGGCLVALPLIVAAASMPWWRFASFHADRGLQAESLLASIVWALHFAGVPAGWEFIRTSNEVTGPLAAALVRPGQLLWMATSLVCLTAATLSALRLNSHGDHGESPHEGHEDHEGVRHSGHQIQPDLNSVPRCLCGSFQHMWSLPQIAALSLLPVLGFVATNTVFSPQFQLWLIPFAALMLMARGTARGRKAHADDLHPLARRAAFCIFLATFIVPVFYPHREYALGLGLFRTGVLLLRNLMLLYALACLWVAVRELYRTPSRMSTQAV